MNTRQMTWPRGMEWASIARMALILAAALAITNLGLPQPITGPLVNALLLLTVEWCGVSQALLVGMVTPMGAALRGILPLPLLVMIPFIALGNGMLVSLYASLRGRNRWLALGAAAVAKFVLLYAAVTVLVARPLSLAIMGNAQKVAIPASVVNMMSWPQLVTALAGGLIAFGILRIPGRLHRK